MATFDNDADNGMRILLTPYTKGDETCDWCLQWSATWTIKGSLTVHGSGTYTQNTVVCVTDLASAVCHTDAVLRDKAYNTLAWS